MGWELLPGSCELPGSLFLAIGYGLSAFSSRHFSTEIHLRVCFCSLRPLAAALACHRRQNRPRAESRRLLGHHLAPGAAAAARRFLREALANSR